MKVSILLTAWKEEKTIGKVIKCLVDKQYSGLGENFELILACPDDETHIEAKRVVEELNLGDRFIHIKDPKKGKPYALNLLTQKASGDVWVFTDGDVWLEKNAIGNLLKHFELEDNKRFKDFAVTGRPISADSDSNIMGYYGHLLADAAHHKRTIDLTDKPEGKSLAFVKKRNFFPVSGYIYATKPFKYKFPEDCLVDDAYISYMIYNNGGRIEYAPDSVVYVKYPKTLEDYFKQKKRSVGGYTQLWRYGVVKQDTKTRTFWRELEYFWFPLTYAKSLKKLVWSLLLYPIRLWLWVQIYFERKMMNKDFEKTWTRIESTK